MLRRVDLTAKTIDTLAGVGKQAHFGGNGGSIKVAALNSPWDLCHVGHVLYIAMAGPHQLWSHRLGSSKIGVYAGNGREDIVNGSFDSSSFAQPSGITTDGEYLFVCDSEGSAVRKVSVGTRGTVSTVVGTSDLQGGRSLFEFGDRDGIGSEVRLQHPLGVVYHDGKLFVADSYNQKIKEVDLKSQQSTTWLGTGEAGDSLDPPQLSEPAGVSIANGKLYIADTNNHRICVVDLQTRKMSVLTIEGLKPPKPVEEDDRRWRA